MLHLFFLGMILGWGAAIPIGPVNLEITRRNLRFGTGYGVSLGLGACTADLTYLVLLCSGAIVLLQHAILLRVVGLLGSAVLIWFGISALRMKASAFKNKPITTSYFRNSFEGYLITLLNPYTILFWASVSAQLSIAAAGATAGEVYATVAAGLGVIFGTVSWVIFLNLLIHFTRHKLSDKVMHRLNRVGGMILLCFAAFSVVRIILEFI